MLEVEVCVNVSGIRAALFAAVISITALTQTSRWILPVPDGGDIEPSPPSVHGYLVAAAKQSIKVKRDSRDASMGTTVNVQLRPKTEFFTAYAELTVPTTLARDSMFGSGTSPQIPQKQERPLVQLW
jgi:hypothetical protein